MLSTITQASAMWRPVEHPAASPQASVASAAAGGRLDGGLTEHMGLRQRKAVSGVRSTGLSTYRTTAFAAAAGSAPAAGFAATAGFAPAAIRQSGFLADTGVPAVLAASVPTASVLTVTVPTATVPTRPAATVPTATVPTRPAATVPTTSVRNEKQHDPGPPVLRPPL